MSEPLHTAPTTPATVACPKCHTAVTYYDRQNSTCFTCPKCRTFFEARGEMPARIVDRFKSSIGTVLLPLGTKGTLFGDPYRVVGFMVKKEARSPARWAEFVLLNEATGKTAQLAVYEGHWMFIQPVEKQYDVTPAYMNHHSYVDTLQGAYQIYNRYSPRILYAIGEFDWNILDDEQLVITEFIAPPFMLVREDSKVSKVTHWFKGEHLEPSQISTAFNIEPHRLPYPEGVGAVQPGPVSASWEPLKTFTLWLLLLLVLTQLYFVVAKPAQQLVYQEFRAGQNDSSLFAVPVPENAAVLVSKSFQVNGPTALNLRMRAAVDNKWVELPVSLVNEQTGQSYEFSRSLEYYHGYEDGESWAEGDNDAEATLAKVPSGRYHLNIYPATENNQVVYFNVSVTQHAGLTSNVIVVAVLLLIWPGIQYWRRQAHEAARWSQSDYGPQA